jgi:acyl dehydratase
VEFEVEKGAVRRFAEAIGENNPLYLDEAYAQAHGYARVIAPPTFPTTFRIPLNLNIEASRFLHGEQEYTYMRPIVAGDVIRCVSTITDVYEKQGSLGAMTFLVSEIRGSNLHGEPVFTGRSLAIIR